jgi:hypothetical protein
MLDNFSIFPLLVDVMVNGDERRRQSHSNILTVLARSSEEVYLRSHTTFTTVLTQQTLCTYYVLGDNF